MRTILLATLLVAGALLCAGEDPPPREFRNVMPRGPQVEVSLRDGREPFYCFLTGYKDGTVNFQMLAGEVRQERAADVQSIRFMEGPPPDRVGPDRPEGRPDRPPERRPGNEDTRRMKELAEKDAATGLSVEELDELYKLRDKAPVFPGDPGPIERRMLAKKFAQREEFKGRIERHISASQQRLKRADSEDEARDLMILLSMAYAQKGMLPGKIRDQLQRDAQLIPDAEIRKKVERFTDLPEFPGPRRKDAK